MLDFSAPSTFANAVLAAAERLRDAAINARDAYYEVFGASEELDAILDDWAKNGPPLNEIKMLDDDALPGIDAAYAIDIDTIFVSRSLVERGSQERIVDALIEELGHRLDALLGGDTAGDEGEALAAVLRGESAPQTSEDGSVLVVPGYGETAIEPTTTVADSGGYEGSVQTLQLESTNGSTITYYYEHYSIPDRFIIRYEGRNIVDTGFTGGSRTGTVQLPAGTANTVQVIVATDNAGTAWNYNISAEPLDCSAPAPWIVVATTEFEKKDPNKDECEGSGTVTIGRQDGVANLLQIGTSKAVLDADSLNIDGGIVRSGIGGIAGSLFTADIKMNLLTGIAALENIQPGSFKLAGLDVDFKGMAVLSDRIGFDVRFKMPDAASGLLVDTTDFFSHGLQITNTGAYPVLGFRIDPPGAQEFKLAGFIDVKASQMAIEYRPGEDALRLQAKIEFTNTNFAKTKSGLEKLEADLSGPNYIQVNSDGDVDVIGTLKATGNIDLVKGWSIQGLEMNVNTTTREVGGAGTLGTPFGVKFGEGATARAEVEFVYDPFQLDKVGLTLDNLNKPIPAYPAFFFQRIGGSVDNFAPSNNKDVEGNFTIGATIGPKIAGTSLALAQFDAKVSSKFLEGKMTTDILTANFNLDLGLVTTDLGTFTLIKDESTAKLDWSKGELSFVGTTNVLDGFFITTGSFKANSSFDFGFARTGQMALPNFVPVYGGAKIANANLAVSHTNDGVSGNDYAAGWGQYTVNTPWDTYNLTLGLRINFDGTVTRIGTGNIPTTSSWYISPGRDYVVLSAMWENASNDVKVQVIKPDGTVIDEADFLANRIMVVEDFSGSNARSVIIDAPEEGTWDLEIVDTTGLGQITTEATGAVELPEFTFTGAPLVNADGTVTYSYEATTTTPITSVNFYFDDDLTDRDGVFAGSVIASDGTGTFSWDPVSVVPGNYFMYAMVDDGSGPIVFADMLTSVSVGSEADLSVTIKASLPEARSGDTVQLEVRVENTSADTMAKGAKALVNLPDGVTVADSSLALGSSDVAGFEVDLSDLAAGEVKTFTIDVVVDAGAVAGDQFAADVYVMADTYDAETLNDGAAVQFIVPPDPAVPTVDLSVDSKIDLLTDISLNDRITYTVTVTNSGSTDATNVVLTEIVQGLTGFSSVPTGAASGNRYTVKLGTIAAGESVDVEISATASTAGQATATTSISADGFDTAIANNEEFNIKAIQGVTPAEADLSVTLTDVSTGSATENQVKVSINNIGPGVASNVQVEVKLPAGAVVSNTSAIQGSYDATTGIWTIGNLRDNLTRDLLLTISGLDGTAITAEVVTVAEADPDSTPADGMGDDFASITGVAAGQSGLIDGTDGDDVLIAIGTDDTINAMAGNDEIRPGGGVDLITTGDGRDVVKGTMSDLNGDTITDLSTADTIVFTDATFNTGDMTLLSGNPAQLQIDTDGDATPDVTVNLDGIAEDGGFLAWQRASQTRVFFQDDLPKIGEGRALAADKVNGIANQDALVGDGATQFATTMSINAAAMFNNSLGVYEIDGSGAISDVRILAANVKTASGALAITGVEDGHKLGFFVIQDGADFANGLAATDTLIFVDSSGAAANADADMPIMLSVNGKVYADNVFHSYDADLNSDGVQHAISGLSEDRKSLMIGFEDLLGGGDKDYQDVLFSVSIM